MSRPRQRPARRNSSICCRLLVDELREIGAQDVRLTDYGAVLATIPATVKTAAPTIAFLAHVDTSPAFSGTGVEPIVHRNYAGGDIVLPDDPTRCSRRSSCHTWRDEGRRRHHHRQRNDPAGRGRQGRRRDRHGDGPAPAGATATSRTGRCAICFTPDEEIGRGVHANLPGDLQAEVGVHAGRRGSGRDRLRDVLGRQGGRDESRASRSIPARPRTSWSTRCTWRPRSSTRCRR